MAQELPRAALQIDRLYYCQPADKYFYTPDGVGLVWYETKAEALEQTNAFGQAMLYAGLMPAEY